MCEPHQSGTLCQPVPKGSACQPNHRGRAFQPKLWGEERQPHERGRRCQPNQRGVFCAPQQREGVLTNIQWRLCASQQKVGLCLQAQGECFANNTDEHTHADVSIKPTTKLVSTTQTGTSRQTHQREDCPISPTGRRQPNKQGRVPSNPTQRGGNNTNCESNQTGTMCYKQQQELCQPNQRGGCVSDANLANAESAPNKPTGSFVTTAPKGRLCREGRANQTHAERGVNLTNGEAFVYQFNGEICVNDTIGNECANLTYGEYRVNQPTGMLCQPHEQEEVLSTTSLGRGMSTTLTGKVGQPLQRTFLSTTQRGRPCRPRQRGGRVYHANGERHVSQLKRKVVRDNHMENCANQPYRDVKQTNGERDIRD